MANREHEVHKAASADAAILELTICAYVVAERAAGQLADCLINGGDGAAAVQQAERELDRLDRQVDSLVTASIAEVAAEQARELLGSMKMVLDLERIGDLLASVASRAAALGKYGLAADDANDLIKMATVIEKMLGDANAAFTVRNLDRATAVLRADAEVDRYRNLILIRQLEMAQTNESRSAIHVVSMSQALERAGDHVKNLAEEICHLATGRSVRHSFRDFDKPDEQMYLDYLRQRHGLAGDHSPQKRPTQPAGAGD